MLYTGCVTVGEVRWEPGKTERTGACVQAAWRKKHCGRNEKKCQMDEKTWTGLCSATVFALKQKHEDCSLFQVVAYSL